jgi:hypothetical protein
MYTRSRSYTNDGQHTFEKKGSLLHLEHPKHVLAIKSGATLYALNILSAAIEKGGFVTGLDQGPIAGAQLGVGALEAVVNGSRPEQAGPRQRKI